MTRNEFTNLMKGLRFVDRDDIEDALDRPIPESRWIKFRDDPWRFFVGADDEIAEAIWSCIMAKMPTV